MPKPDRDRDRDRIWWLSWVDEEGRELSPRYKARFREPGSKTPLTMPEVDGAVGIAVWPDRKGGRLRIPEQLFEDVR